MIRTAALLVTLSSLCFAVLAGTIDNDEAKRFRSAPPLVAVIANPAIYNNQIVLLKGILVRDEGAYALYLSRDDALYGIQSHGVKVYFPPNLENLASRANGEFVFVQGTFNDTSSPRGGYIGKLTKVSRIRMLTEVPLK